MAQPLADDDVRVWYRFTEAILDDEVEALSTILSDDERVRASRFVFARDRRDFTVAHALLRRTLSLYGDVAPTAWAFEAPPHGKPAIVAGQADGLTFNLSHTHGLVACGVARNTAIGVDVESIDRISSEREIAERFFSPSECRGLDTCEGTGYTTRFIELWTLKESYIKGIGVGLSHPLDNFSFDFSADRGIGFAAPRDVDTGSWQFALTAPSPRYRLAVAAWRNRPGARYRVTLHDASPEARSDAAPAAILRET